MNRINRKVRITSHNLYQSNNKIKNNNKNNYNKIQKNNNPKTYIN